MREAYRREISWKQVEEGRFLLDEESRDLFLAKTKNVFEIAKIITRRKSAVYLYAGTVRNLLLGIETSLPDYDFIGDFDLDQIQGDFPKLMVGRWDEVNTLRLKIGSYSFDFTSTKNMKERLALTDMTISTLVLSENGDIFDYFGGLESLRNGEIKMDDPELKITRDPGRILRAFRFAAELGFTIESETLAAIIKHALLLRGLRSLDDEIWQILALDEPIRGEVFKALTKFGVDRYMSIPENVLAAIDEYSLEKDVKRISQVDEVVKMLNCEIYLGGGAIRDLIWGKRINDLDFEVNLPLEDIIRILEENGFTRIEGYQTSEHQYYISTFAGVVGAVINGVDVHLCVMTGDATVSTLLEEGDVNFSCCVFNVSTRKVENPQIIREIKDKRLLFCDIEHAKTDPLIIVNALKQISHLPDIVIPEQTRDAIKLCIPDVVKYFRAQPGMKYKLASICGNLNSEEALAFFDDVYGIQDIFDGIDMKKRKLSISGEQYCSQTVEELLDIDRTEIVQLIRSAFGEKYKPTKEFPSKINSVVFERQNGRIVACCLIDGERVYVASAKSGHDWIEIFSNLVANNYNIWCAVDCDNPKVQALCTLGGLSLETNPEVMRKILISKGGKRNEDLDIYEYNGMLVFRDLRKQGYAQVLLRS